MGKIILTKEEFLTVKELSERIKYKIQSIYNLIYQEKFVLGKHFLKPSPKKILFKWSAILEWLRDKSHDQTNENKVYDFSKLQTEKCVEKKKPSKRSLINI